MKRFHSIMNFIIFKSFLRRIIQLLVTFHNIADFSHRREAQHSSLAVLSVYFRNLLMLTVMWAVFTYGLKAKLASGMGYFPYFAPAYIAWTLFADSTQAAFGYLKANKFICENSKIRLDAILIANIYKNLQVQLLLLVTLLMTLKVTSTDHIKLSLGAIVLGLLFLCTTTLFLSAMAVICTLLYPRIDFYLSIIVSVIFWSTPIVWSYEIIPAKYQSVMALNPFFQLVGLYREAFGVEQNFHISSLTVVYLLVSLALALISLLFFNKHHLAIIDKLK